MIQIRQSIFETNSSSTHSICISKGKVDLTSLPKSVWFDLDSYNWEHEKVHDNASYLYTGIMDIYDEELKMKFFNRLRTIMQKYHINAIFEDPEGKHFGIDHADILISFLEDITTNEDKLLRFLFHPDSCVQMGNDNSYDEDDICRCAEPRIFSEEEMKMIDNPLHDEEHFEYFLKDN